MKTKHYIDVLRAIDRSGVQRDTNIPMSLLTDLVALMSGYEFVMRRNGDLRLCLVAELPAIEALTDLEARANIAVNAIRLVGHEVPIELLEAEARAANLYVRIDANAATLRMIENHLIANAAMLLEDL